MFARQPVVRRIGMKCWPWGPALLLLVAPLPSVCFGQTRAERAGYRFPEIMVIVYADFPNQPEHQLALAKYTLGKGFNCVEAELDKLDVCRRAGLKVRLGSIDISKLLQAAPKLKDDPAVFGYFISDRRTSKAFPGFAKIARDFEAADPNHPTLFINPAEYNQFPGFVEVVKPMVLDYYHYHWYPKNHPERYYLYLRMFRDLSVQHDIPQMRCLGSNNPPEKLRQSMYVALAYGPCQHPESGSVAVRKLEPLDDTCSSHPSCSGAFSNGDRGKRRWDQNI